MLTVPAALLATGTLLVTFVPPFLSIRQVRYWNEQFLSPCP